MTTTAAQRWAAIDFDATDGLSVDELGLDVHWAEPDEDPMNVLLALQLWWPTLGPGVETMSEKKSADVAFVEQAAATGALQDLPYRERRILALSYGMEGGRPHDDDEIAALSGVTAERVRQVRRQALAHLRGDLTHRARSLSAIDWLDPRMPPYGAEGCRCGNTATPAADCPLHYFMVVVERLETAVAALLDNPTAENVSAAGALIGRVDARVLQARIRVGVRHTDTARPAAAGGVEPAAYVELCNEVVDITGPLEDGELSKRVEVAQIVGEPGFAWPDQDRLEIRVTFER